MQLTPRDMQKFFSPDSIAFVGVSRSGERFGGLSFLRKYIEAGYTGRLYPINPKADHLLGLKAWPDLNALPETPDLAMIAVAAPKVVEVLAACARKGIRHIHLFSSGFDELGSAAGRELKAQVMAVCREHQMLMIGPNCMGPYRPASRLTAWGAIPGRPGPLGIISQSGGMTQRLTEYAASLGLGVEKAVSVGNGFLLNPLDFLEAFGKDPDIRVIGMYLESVADGRRLLELAGRIGRDKPIVLIKGGETEAGARTAASHTGAMAGSHAIWEAVIQQANMVQVRTLDGWLDTLMAFVRVAPPASDGVFIIGGGGGSSVIYGDTCIREGLRVPALGRQTMDHLQKIMPAAGSIAGNPLDHWLVFSDPAYLARLIDLAEQDPAIAMILVDRLIARNAFHMQDVADPTPETIARLEKRQGLKPIVFVVDSEGGDGELAAAGAAVRAAYGQAGYAVFPGVIRAARALARLHRYYAKRGRIKARVLATRRSHTCS
jgi:acyl-CoA synthetase (NDP forming)